MIFFILALTGLFLILLSTFLTYPERSQFVPEFIKELGIVLLSVFTVSLIYEILLADIHMDNFRSIFIEIAQSLQSNAKSCNELGIIKIFPLRTTFEQEYPFTDLMNTLNKGSSVRIVARTLFHIMNKSASLNNALIRGVKIELCLLSPMLNNDLAKTVDLNIHDYILDKSNGHAR